MNLNKVGLEFHDRVDEPMWIDRLQKLADSDDRNPLLSGYACAVLLERGLIANESLAREVSRPPVAGHFCRTRSGLVRGFVETKPLCPLGAAAAVGTTGRLCEFTGRRTVSPRTGFSSSSVRRIQSPRKASYRRESWRMLGRSRRHSQRTDRATADGKRRTNTLGFE